MAIYRKSVIERIVRVYEVEAESAEQAEQILEDAFKSKNYEVHSYGIESEEAEP